jgi:hypothetical protein
LKLQTDFKFAKEFWKQNENKIQKKREEEPLYFWAQPNPFPPLSSASSPAGRPNCHLF